MRGEPLTSIVMSLYNCENYVIEAIESVISQSYKNWELIIVDDCSSDNSVTIVEEYIGKELRIKLYKMDENSGVTAVRNYAITKAVGRYMAFLDCDDVWLPDKLEKQITMMQTDSILFSYSSYYAINENSIVTGLFNVDEKVTYRDMLKTSVIGTLTMIYNVDVLGKYYFQNIGHEDYVLKLALLKKVKYAKGLNEPLAKYRIVRKSLSANKLKTALWQWKIYREIEQLSLIQSLYYFIQYIYFGLIKYK